MKKTIKNLNNIKIGVFIALLIGAGFMTTDNYKIIAILIVIISLIVEWKLIRCPICNKALDPRLNITEETFCPFCGNRMGT
jgi:hypothetical protein